MLREVVKDCCRCQASTSKLVPRLKQNYTSSFAWLSGSRACFRVTKCAHVRFPTSRKLHTNLRLKQSAFACFQCHRQKILSVKEKQKFGRLCKQYWYRGQIASHFFLSKVQQKLDSKDYISVRGLQRYFHRWISLLNVPFLATGKTIELPEK